MRSGEQRCERFGRDTRLTPFARRRCVDLGRAKPRAVLSCAAALFCRPGQSAVLCRPRRVAPPADSTIPDSS
ncbi:hypothetical protein GPZ74_25900 [Burkholderia pseudomallei]|nr:hypothetical protein CNX72_17070 [Burkholderia pseudomallei]MBG1247713.1 hypothetical protein [Burkholderia pseudomallei]MBK3336556.1 hypothetical protein [Burkholderia pseudomallei]MBM5624528.1 hypothetical protein [Burkholderia pseudomallei]MPT61498.1 hypothetical protein [Burkholderia pseudomallei]